ncbi:tRNA dihydrouridine(20/20a) synthase DusA [Aliihoeflea sp. 40Bstr573]|uniref:tRNA dihydrouridine(20/20a) synthase DusA n=1 Tax=Aliihoeflea sp. 40Bstr573 TaxID=2696467 RepID=UPI0020940C83|nr:tRNA dihydrouridine(20/20a) synthase DusA [Aliihoeflea sp. 40Bstr573]MCO6385548.1 tRNA dihydrouridine(20/20a) synthase DusA [Aliihoeflea sp. 40Bstr573]
MSTKDANLHEGGTPALYRRPVFAIAPMMDWTDRHCRYFHRQMTRHALLYTEMVVADAVIHGNRDRLLGFAPDEHPVALQLGGSDPVKLATAAEIAAEWGYDEINLNVGCPSDRVQSGTFGACLMRTPDLVAECVSAMKARVSVPITVKCRIGVDEQDPQIALDEIADKVIAAGADALWVHARKAWLQGLSPKENRDIPPLDYGRVYSLKARLGANFVGINGGIADLDESVRHLEKTDGVMLGRAAYHNPGLLADVDRRIFEAAEAPIEWPELIDRMADYCAAHIAGGGRLTHVTRHMVGLFHGLPGARRFRQILSTDATKAGAGPDVLHAAFGQIELDQARDAA